MIKKFRKAISLYFLFYPKSSRLTEFKDELLGVMMDNYNEELANGESEAAAYKKVVSTLENYRETADELAKLRKDELTTVQRKVFLMAEIVFLAFAVALYFIVSVATGAWGYTWLVYIIWACVSLLALFFYILAKVRRNSVYILVRCTIMIITMLVATILYIIVSFSTQVWAATWIIFIIGLGAAYIIDIFYRQHYKVMRFTKFDWLVLSMLVNLCIYFGLSFGIIGTPWSWSWICFIIWAFVAAAGLFVMQLSKYKKNGQLKGLFNIPLKVESKATDEIAADNDGIGECDSSGDDAVAHDKVDKSSK